MNREGRMDRDAQRVPITSGGPWMKLRHPVFLAGHLYSERGLRGCHVRTRYKFILKDVHNRKLFWLV